ncbi:hypothetical protein ACFS07_27525 [Undibacterium arcticum]
MTANPAAPATTATTTTATKQATKPANKLPATAAPGGGHGRVWVNTASNTYYCRGAKYYGTTKTGAYMSEADARAKGNHPKRKKACS